MVLLAVDKAHEEGAKDRLVGLHKKLTPRSEPLPLSNNPLTIIRSITDSVVHQCHYFHRTFKLPVQYQKSESPMTSKTIGPLITPPNAPSHPLPS
jgi:hypothetical protein